MSDSIYVEKPPKCRDAQKLEILRNITAVAGTSIDLLEDMSTIAYQHQRNYGGSGKLSLVVKLIRETPVLCDSASLNLSIFLAN